MPETNPSNPKNHGSCPVDKAPQPNPQVANPIHAGTGNKFQAESDYRQAGEGVLSFSRYYNSAPGVRQERMGQWRHSYNRSILHVTTDATAIVYRADGKVYFFTETGGVWIGDPDITDELERLTDGGGATTGWSYTIGKRTEMYDASGRLLSITDESGLTQTLHYDSTQAENGDDDPQTLDRVEGPFGRSLYFSYNSFGYLATMTDPQGGIYTYTYDSSNDHNLISVAYPDDTPADPNDNPLRTYHYEDANFPRHLTGITDENAVRFATWGYDSEGRANLSEHAGGAEHTDLVYNADGTTTVTRADGTTSTYGFDVVHGSVNVSNISGDACQSCGGNTQMATYDANGFVASTTGWNGNVTQYTHNARGLETSRTEAAGTTNARTISTTWHPDYRLPLQITAPSVASGQSAITTFNYDDAANPQLVTRITRSGFRPDGSTTATRTITTQYTTGGRVSQIDGPRTDVNDLTTFTYYPDDPGQGSNRGMRATVTNSLGHTVTYNAYDAHGNVLSLTDANGVVTGYQYDARQRVMQITETPPQGVGRVTGFTYDNLGQLLTATTPAGVTLTYSYDGARYLRSITDGLGNVIEYGYDLKGNRNSELSKDPAGTLVRQVQYTHDARDRVASINQAGSLTQYIYDAVGNLTGETDPNNRSTSNSYDVLNRLIETVDALAGTTSYNYDVNDRLIEVVAPNDAATQYSYDDLGNLLSETSPDRGTRSYVYDAAGNQLSVTDGRGVTAAYVYDALGRVTSVDYPGTAEDQTFTYDSGAACSHGIGTLCQIVDESGSIEYGYDAFGNRTQLVRTVLGISYVTQYEYDADDRITRTIYPDGRVVDISRDVLGRATGVNATVNGSSTPIVSNLMYRADGLLTEKTFANSLIDSRRYDGQGWLLSQSLTTTSGQPPGGSAPQASDDTASTLQSQPTTIDVLSNDSDVDGDALNIIVLGQSAVATTKLNTDGTVTYTPQAGFFGTDSFTYKVTDGGFESGFATVTVTVEADTDLDGLPNDWEAQYGLDPADPTDALDDLDGDGVSNLDEYLQGSDPSQWEGSDTDGDGMPDNWELNYGLNPQDPSDAAADPDNDGRSNLIEFQEGTDPTVADLPPGTFAVSWTDWVGVTVDANNVLIKTANSAWGNSGAASSEFIPDDGAVEFTPMVTNTYRMLGLSNGNASASYNTINYAIHANASGKILVYENGSSKGTYGSYAVGDVLRVQRTGTTVSYLHNGVVFYTSATPSSGDLIADAALYTNGATIQNATLYGAVADVVPPVISSVSASPSNDQATVQWQTNESAASRVEYGVVSPGENSTTLNSELATSHTVTLTGLAPSTSYLYQVFSQDASGNEQAGPVGSFTTLAASVSVDWADLVGVTVETDNTLTKTAGTGWGTGGAASSQSISADGAIEFTAVVNGNWRMLGLSNSNASASFNTINYAVALGGTTLYVYENGALKASFGSYADGDVLRVQRTGNTVSYLRNGSVIYTSSVASSGNLIADAALYNAASQIVNARLVGATAPLVDAGNHEGETRRLIARTDTENQLLKVATRFEQSTGERMSLQAVAYGAETILAAGLASSNTVSSSGSVLVVIPDTQAGESPTYRFYGHAAEYAGEWREIDIRQAHASQPDLLVVSGEGYLDVWSRRVGVNVSYRYQRVVDRNAQDPGGYRFMKVSSPAAEMRDYVYDGKGNVLQVINAQSNRSYLYDALDRVVEDGVLGGAATLLGYDPNGNRLSETVESVTRTLGYAASSNRLTAIDGSSIVRDAVGNRVSDQAGNRTFEYNNANRLYQVYEGGQLTATYTYNALGQRSRKVTAAGTVVVYHYDLGGRLIAETSASGTPIRDYLWLDDQPIAQIDVAGAVDTVTYLHTDHLGTPRTGTDTTGTVVWRWDSDAFGTSAANDDPDQDGAAVTVNLRFPGQYYDQETGLHYNGARYYDPALGRYITADPLGLVGILNGSVNIITSTQTRMPGLVALKVGAQVNDYDNFDRWMNLYAYASANPLRYIDPLGLDRFDICEDFGTFGQSVCKACVKTACSLPAADKFCCKVDFDDCVGESGGDTEKMKLCTAQLQACNLKKRPKGPKKPDNI